MKGIDVSEHNGNIDWQAVVDDGNEFAIIRIGWGDGHLDDKFYDNFNGARDAGLKVGIYFYSEALNPIQAIDEARWVMSTLDDCGITSDMLEMGMWLDQENDNWKESHGLNDPEEITEICRTFLEELSALGYPCDLYANYYYLTEVINLDALPYGTRYWCAQYNNSCDFNNAYIWQYTDSHYIGDSQFDGNISY